MRIVARCGRRTGKTVSMVIYMLWYAFTHEDSIQVVATPYESQIKLIFDMLRQFIAASPEIAESVSRQVKSPYEVEFRNGAKIKGFTAGTKGGNEGGSLRGQRADILYMDELDYMTDGDFTTIFAIALEDPEHTKVWISSTPTGRRGVFWKTCVGSIPGWTEHYAWAGMVNPDWTPGMSENLRMVNPDWSVDMEAELRATFSDQGYLHEILADFGEETVGVFKKAYIDRARKRYEYIEKRYSAAPMILGVDWDKFANATQLLIMQYLESFDETGRFQVVQRIEIPSGEYTFDVAVNKIVELNETYDLDYIYIDRGYGEYQIETLKLYGIDNPRSGMKEKVVGVSLGSSKEIMDPATKEIIKKPMKAFIVDQLVIMFERDRLIINDSDEMVIMELENYRMVKQTAGGATIFSDGEDHAICCMTLCMLGFLEKYPELLKTVKAVEWANKTREIKLNQSNPLDVIVKDKDEEKKNIKEQHLIKVDVGTKRLGNTLVDFYGRGRRKNDKMVTRGSF